MSRTSPIHYINPSSISITPNANGSANDLAVYVARGTKIKVYVEGTVDMDDSTSTYQEWTLTGRNRRLSDYARPADQWVPYTIYARISKSGEKTGYLIFTPQQKRDNKWIDKYPSLGSSSEYYGTPSSDAWYVRMGEVTIEEGSRSVNLDTGILGTDRYNESYNITPDELPLRVELGCTIDDEDAGPTPYVHWGQTAVLTASLVEGWSSTDSERFDHWEIIRNSSDSTIDGSWPAAGRKETFRTTGVITLAHSRSSVADDFNAAVSASFTVIAMGTPESGSSSELVELASATINILAETVEKYELSLSTGIVSYNPQDKTYSPGSGVTVLIRATDQSGTVFTVSKEQVDAAGIIAGYKSLSERYWTPLSLSGDAVSPASGTIPVSAFALQTSVTVRITNAEGKELSIETIAFVRDGEDSREREWIFLRSQSAVTFGDAASAYPRPSLISSGQVSPAAAADGTDDDKNQDGWVPEGWWNNPQGVDSNYIYEYGSYRDYNREDSEWGEFSVPRIWAHYAVDAVTYDIVPSLSVINAYADGTVYSGGISVKAFRTENGVRSDNILPTKEITSNNKEYFAEYIVDGDSWTDCDFVQMTMESGGQMFYGVPPSIVKSAKSNIALRLKHVDNEELILCEISPIEVVKDGQNGEDAYMVEASPAVVSFNCDQSGHSTDTSTKEVELSMFKGAEAVAFTASVVSTSNCTAWVAGSLIRISTGMAWNLGGAILYTEKAYPYVAVGDTAYDTFNDMMCVVSDVGNDFISVNGTSARYTSVSNMSYNNLASAGSVKVSLVSGEVSRSVVITVVGNKQGATGQAGAAGPMLYPAGRWDSAKTYTANGDSLPYVLYSDGKFYYLSDSQASGIDVPGLSSKWVVMTQVDVIYAKFGIMDYGKMASAVFCGDWMYSQYGKLYIDSNIYFTDIGSDNCNTAVTIGGATAEPFAFFNPDYPQGRYAGTFAPNWAVNMKTGAQYAARGNFVIGANDGYVELCGTIRATNLYHAVVIHGNEDVYYCYDAAPDPDGITTPYPYTLGEYYNGNELDIYWGDKGLRKCIGPADIVVTKNSNNEYVQYDTGVVYETRVLLPRAQDYDGKLVEIIDTRYTQPESGNYVPPLKVLQVDYDSRIKSNISQESSFLSIITLNGSSDYSGDSYRLLSYGGYWVLLD